MSTLWLRMATWVIYITCVVLFLMASVSGKLSILLIALLFLVVFPLIRKFRGDKAEITTRKGLKLLVNLALVFLIVDAWLFDTSAGVKIRLTLIVGALLLVDVAPWLYKKWKERPRQPGFWDNWHEN